MKQRTPFAIAWSVWALSMGALLVPFAYRLTGHRVAGLGDQPASIGAGLAVLLFIPSFATVGAILAAKRPTNPVGWLVLASGLCYALGTLGILVGSFSTRWSDWLGSWVWGVGIGITGTFVLLLFPTGTLPSRRWRPVAWLAGIALGGTFLGNAFTPGVMQGTHSINPLGIGGPAGTVFRVLQSSFGLVVPAGLAAFVSLVFRFRRAQFSEREQIKWLVYAGALLVIGVIAASIVPSLVSSPDLGNNLQNSIISGSFVFVPLAIGIAVLKYRLYDIDVVINKTVVFGALAAFITAVYVAIVVGIGAAIGQGTSKPNLGLSILATAVVAVAFQPVRERIQRFANHLVYGKRATPYEVLSEFASRMAGASAIEEVLPRMARVLAQAAGAARADIWLKVGGELRTEASWPSDESQPPPVPLGDHGLPPMPGADRAVPVLHQGELLGAISIRKRPGESLTPIEDKLVSDLASQAGLMLPNVRLTEELLARLEDLRASRRRLVAAQDAERRRIECNIHDGAQQQLVALAVQLRLAESLAGKDQDKERTLVAQIKAGAHDALENLRELARGIYPPLLAQQGLAAALEAQARRAPVAVTVVADGVGRHPQEVEAAVYFCCQEALQNVAKYAGTSKAMVRLHEVDARLGFEVTDDGRGFDASNTSYGTGLQGMADRLSALGGELTVQSVLGAGTTVSGWLPLRVPEAVG